jgi:outer membrane lipoprotein-sorting protein
MKKTILIIISLAVFTVGSAYAQDLQKILDKYFKTIGQEKILKVETIVSTGKTLQMGMEMPFKTITKRPNKAYMEVDIQGVKMVMAFDGKNGWAIQPWTGSQEPVDLLGPELRPMREMSDMDGSLWNYVDKGHQIELLGTEEMEGTKVYVLKVTRKDGDISHYYLDSEKYVMLKLIYSMVINGQETEMVFLMSNYQDVEGYIMPFKTEQRFNGQSDMTITFDEVKFNVDIDDAVFLKPAPADPEN